jgi:hypothetical protein
MLTAAAHRHLFTEFESKSFFQFHVLLNSVSWISEHTGSLANVINALTVDAIGTSTANSTAARHVPFRDSKLTHMLRDSLVSCTSLGRVQA